MKTAASKVAMLCLAAALAPGCESVKEVAATSSETIIEWFDEPEGSYFARQVGGGLSEDDALAIEMASARALEWTPAGKTVTWSNSRTGTHAAITPGERELDQRRIRSARNKAIAPAPDLELIAQTWSAQRNANLRAAPGTDNQIVGGLAKGETFTAIGTVEAGSWIMVGIDGKAVGYVFAKLVRPVKSRRTPELREDEIDLDADSMSKGVVVETATVATACRRVDYTVSMGAGEPAKEAFRACKASDGAWEID
jgi:surface antigen